MPRQKTKFGPALKNKFPFLNLQAGSASDVLCTICHGRFSVGSGGSRDIGVHVNSKAHILGLEKIKNTPSIATFLSNNNNNDDPAVMKLSAKELTFAFHTGKHQISGRTAACTSRLIAGLFDETFSGGATKTMKLITKVNWQFLKI